jgi:hypothetical protein
MIRRAALGGWLLRVAFGAVLAAGLASPTDGWAQASAPDRPRPDVPSPEQIFDKFDLQSPDSCIAFRTWQRLRVRKERWLDALRRLASLHPDVVYGWLVGARRPPDRAIAEATHQRDCLLDAIVRTGAAPASDLQLEFTLPDRQFDGPAARRRWLRRAADSRARRRRLRRIWTVSDHRSALSQARIWRRKYLFVGRAFNRVSADAADRCSLPEGTTWKPGRAHHAYCWNDVLSGREREREILSASSAPGLSRHHWGTEFDLFSLSPGDFRPGRVRHDEYEWLRDHARGFGFFQSYRPHSAIYMPERWHWSYYPIAQALTEFASTHRNMVGDHLNRLWDRLERRFNGNATSPVPYFRHIRDHWQPYIFDVFVPTFEHGGGSHHETFD